MSAVEGSDLPRFSLVIVPGVSVEKWARAWSERLPGVRLQVRLAEVGEAAALVATEADAGLIRLPVDQHTLHAIPLYTETTVVVVALDHLLAAAEEVTVADLAGEVMLRPADDVLAWLGGPAAEASVPVDTTVVAIELVAAGGGVLVVPQSLARAYHCRDLTYRVVTDAPTSSVALAWRREDPSDLIEELIGIVRGRTVNSTRGPARSPAPAAARENARRGAPTSPSPRRRGR